MSTGGADWRGFTHHERAVVGGTLVMQLVEVDHFNYHWGSLNIDVTSPAFARSDIVALRNATATQSAFDAAMAAAPTPIADWYADLCTDATNAGISGAEHPSRVCRAWFAVNAGDFAP